MTLEAVGTDEWSRLGVLGKIALICTGTFISIGLFAVGAMLPVLGGAFAGEPGATLLVQLIGGGVAPIFALFSPWAGRLVSRFGVRRVYLASLAIFLIGGVGPALCNSLPQILAFRVILGIGVAGGFTAGMAGIAMVPEQQRHMLYGFASFVGGGICILAFPLVGLLAKQGWQPAFLIHLILLPMALFALGLPRHRAVAVSKARSYASPSGRLAGVPPQLLIIAAIMGWGMASSSLYSPFFLASINITDPSTVGLILGSMSICSLIGSGSYGFVQRLLGTKAMLFIALSAAALGCFTLAISLGVVQAIAGLGLASVGLAIFGAASYAAAIEAIGPEGDSGAATGIVSFAIYLPQFVFPVVAAAVGTRFGPAVVYYLLALLLVIAIGLVLARGCQQGRSRRGHIAA